MLAVSVLVDLDLHHRSSAEDPVQIALTASARNDETLAGAIRRPSVNRPHPDGDPRPAGTSAEHLCAPAPSPVR